MVVGMLDQIVMEGGLTSGDQWFPEGPQPSVDTGSGSSMEDNNCVLSFVCREALVEKC